MGVRHSTVVFLSRATRLVGAACILVWLIASGINLTAAADSTTSSTPNLISTLGPAVVLYLIPGLVLIAMGAMVDTGRLWSAPIILLVGILSLFKLVLLLVPMRGAIFNPPLSCELPTRIACALLCLPCVFAWEDLAEMNRTRAAPAIRNRSRSDQILPADHLASPSPARQNQARPDPAGGSPGLTYAVVVRIAARAVRSQTYLMCEKRILIS